MRLFFLSGANERKERLSLLYEERPPEQPNLLLVFNDLLLNQDGQGHVQADASARYVGFNIPAANPETGEHGMIHARIFTSQLTQYSSPEIAPVAQLVEEKLEALIAEATGQSL